MRLSPNNVEKLAELLKALHPPRATKKSGAYKQWKRTVTAFATELWCASPRTFNRSAFIRACLLQPEDGL